MPPSLDHWPTGAVQLHPGGCALNQRARQLLDLEGEQPPGDPIAWLLQRLRPCARERVTALWQQGLIEQRAWRCEAELEPGGSARWLRIEAQSDSEGLWTLALIDISDLMGAAEPSGSDALARTALNLTEAIPVGTYTMVLRPGAELASFEFMSERFLELTGLKREEALEDPLKGFACVHPEDFEAWVQLNAEAFSNRTPFFGQTRLVVNGELRWITAESVPRHLPDGSIVWEGVLIDVTERVLAQQQLEERRRDLERILDNIPISMAFLDLQQQDPAITFVNSTFQNQLGYTLADIPTLSHWFPRAYPDPDYREQVLQRWQQGLASNASGAGEISQNDEYVITSKAGHQLEMLINSVELDELLVFTFVDVTAFRRAQRRQLHDMDEKLRISLTASAIGHEIRQPLSTILLNSQLALEDLRQAPGLPTLLQQRIEAISQQCRRLSLIAERIGLLLRNVNTDKVPLDLHQVIDSCTLQIQSRLRPLNAQLRLDLPDEPLGLEGDPVQLQLALCNLLRNGLDALELHKTPHPSLLLQARRQAEAIELVVADNGPGFPDDLEPLQPLISLKPDGYGIGLFVVQLSLENHGGSISIGRCPRLGGAEVRLRFPLAADAH